MCICAYVPMVYTSIYILHTHAYRCTCLLSFTIRGFEQSPTQHGVASPSSLLVRRSEVLYNLTLDGATGEAQNLEAEEGIMVIEHR